METAAADVKIGTTASEAACSTTCYLSSVVCLAPQCNNEHSDRHLKQGCSPGWSYWSCSPLQRHWYVNVRRVRGANGRGDRLLQRSK